MSALPQGLKEAIECYLADNGPGSLVEKTSRMSEIYRQGGQSGGALDFAAYLVARLPATFAAADYCLAELARSHPQFAPRSLLDAGSGPGTAAWAAMAAYPDISNVAFLDNNEQFLKLARGLAAQSDQAALRGARALKVDLDNFPSQARADLVIAAYAFAEMPVEQSGKTAIALWQGCEGALLIIEPGTPQGFARIKQARAALLAEGASLVAPCTHAKPCPMLAPGWCHFSVRLSRSREHMHAKKATVPFEDEKFSYLIASRQPMEPHGARILAPPRETKSSITFKLCAENGLLEREIAKRDKAEYKRIRKLAWGDRLE